MLYPPGFYFVKKPKRFVILSSDKSSKRNLSSFFDIKKPRRMEHLQSEEPFSSDPYFRCPCNIIVQKYLENHKDRLCVVRIFMDQTLTSIFDSAENSKAPYAFNSMKTNKKSVI